MNESNSYVQSTNQSYLSTSSPFYLENAYLENTYLENTYSKNTTTYYYTLTKNITTSVFNTTTSIQTNSNILPITSLKHNTSNNSLLNL